MEDKILITDLSLFRLETLLKELDAPAYRARQISQWLYRKLAVSFDEMTDLPKPFRAVLAEHVLLGGLKKVREVKSRDRTIKILFALNDGKTIESAYMPYPFTEGNSRSTVCVSTQAGCTIGCPFCATGQRGFERNLTPGEMIEQVLFFARRLHEGKSTEHITNIVFMGMGEPLANYDNLLQAIVTLNSPDCFGLGARNMTVSTSGLVPQIERLSREKLQVNLAVSLHAANNELRNKLVPLNKQYSLDRLMSACRGYVAATGRRITFEYILFEEVNDSSVQARSLAHLLAGLNCHVNLITANRTGSDYRASSPEAVKVFKDELLRLHIQCTVRRNRGTDIDAGCGQLRARYR